METFVLYKNKKTLLRNTIFCLILLVGSVALFCYNSILGESTNLISSVGFIFPVIGVIGLLCFGLCLLSICKSFSNNVLFSCNEDGFYDPEASQKNPQLIAWSAVESITVSQVSGQNILKILLKDPASYLESKSFITRTKINLAQMSGPGQISLDLGLALNIFPETALENINRCKSNKPELPS